MDLFDSQYFKINKRVLMICGLWPYQSKLGRIIAFAMLASSIFLFVFTLIAGILSQSELDIINTEDTIITISFCFAGLLKCTMFYKQQNKIRNLYERIAIDWNKLTDCSEHNILRSFLLDGRKVNFITMVFCSSAFMIYSCIDFLLRIFNKESEYRRQHNFPYYFRPMVLYEKLYDWQVALHVTVIAIYSGLAYLSAIVTYISSVKHVCALYEIARRRLQNAIIACDKINHPLQKCIEDISLIPKLINVIEMHEQAVRGIRIIKKVFGADFFVLTVFCLSALTIGTFELNFCRADIRSFIRVLLLMPNVMIYLFYVNYSGEQVIQACDNMYTTAYNIEWYKTSSKTRIFVLMIMRRTLKSECLTAGTTIMILSIKNFATIIKTAWSFGTLLLTTQKRGKNEDANFVAENTLI
ncbi:hypothetical protein TSAR_015896 [Trichomalopsis sarcophagae]|uniref:Odorant receptor n=1 Tax=Trichomalopsis sarcophagae TaxID=543379 RepID=A0A232EY27_9HYME|nr:hypothetical protein TSAR_015896 [Trichomalopsis sarcophagae]